MQELQADRAAAQQVALRVKAGCEDFLRYGVPGDCTLEAIETEPPPLKKGEGILDAVEARGRRVRELRADLYRIASAPYPSSYSKAQMRAQIEAQAHLAVPDVTNLIEHDGKIIWPTRRVQVDVFNAQPGAIAFVEIPVSLDPWLHRDALIAALDREIASEADDKAALSHEARQQQEAEVLGDLLAVERDEAALTWSAMEQGLPVEFRSDISPLAILQVQLVTTPRADTLPETSPGFSWPWPHR